MIRPAKWLVLCGVMLLSPIPVSAEEPEPLTKQDLEFLEFLGEWETDEGQWINPMDFTDPPSGEVEKTAHETELPMKRESDALPEQAGEYEW